MRRARWWTALGPLLTWCAAAAAAEPTGSIRGVVYDKEFEAPLAAPQVTIVETGAKVTGTDQGTFVLGDVPPGRYTLVFSKDGYTRQVKADVVVSPGRMTEVEVWLSGELVDMEEFIVQEIEFGGGTEEALLALRMEMPQLMDSVSADLLSRAGAGDAAAGLRLVAGATVQEGKYAVVRGLPDRYVNSQMNYVRLPTADVDKRAVELDQFPSAVIESIQVSKTFTPDQQGDASGGAVNIILKGVPNQTILKADLKYGYNTQTSFNKKFLTYKGGGLNFLGMETRDPQPNGDWDGAVGVTRDRAPVDYEWSLAAGGRHVFGTGAKVGGFANFYYKRDSSFYDDGIDDSYWVEDPGAPMTPRYSQGTPQQGAFNTSLFNVTQGSQEVQWGGLGTLGLETENHRLNVTYMYTHAAEDTATLAEDTRGKAYFYGPRFGYPPYDPDDPNHAGNIEQQGAPWLRNETLRYLERTTDTLQVSGRHTIPISPPGIEGFFKALSPEVDWTLAWSSAGMYEPDKRQFGSRWVSDFVIPPWPPYWWDPIIIPARHLQNKPDANFTMGNLQRTWKEIVEESDQWFVNLKFPFEQWTGSKGYFKMGIFRDKVRRTYDQDSFSNFGENAASYNGEWEDLWSGHWPSETHIISDGPPFLDVDYEGEQKISAWYYMLDVPLTSWLNVIGGARYEDTELAIVNDPEADATWIPPGGSTPLQMTAGAADVTFKQRDFLPSIGFQFKPIKQVTMRGSYSETVARQTFKELSPIQQAEYLGGPVFIGNPDLKMSALKNYDLRLDYTPYDGGLVSVSYFYKDVRLPIEYVQRIANFVYTTPINYPEGMLSGWEFEVRQRMGSFWGKLEGLSLGANATIIQSEVTLPPDEAAIFSAPNIKAPMTTRDMTGAPEFLYNLFMTYDLAATGTQVAVFYTVRGDTLVAGAGQSQGNFVPSVYETEYGTLNLTVTQKLGKYLKLRFQAKNLTNPKITEVYRSRYIGDDVLKTAYRKGIDYSVGLYGEITF